MNDLKFLKPHWVPVWWHLFWTTGRIPRLTYEEQEDLDGYASFGYWYPTSEGNEYQ